MHLVPPPPSTARTGSRHPRAIPETPASEISRRLELEAARLRDTARLAEHSPHFAHEIRHAADSLLRLADIARHGLPVVVDQPTRDVAEHRPLVLTGPERRARLDTLA